MVHRAFWIQPIAVEELDCLMGLPPTSTSPTSIVSWGPAWGPGAIVVPSVQRSASRKGNYRVS
eukprot:2103081-Alexandrium_andersonii.AAC.1